MDAQIMSHQFSSRPFPLSTFGRLAVAIALVASVWADPVASATPGSSVLRVAVQHVPAEPDATNIRVYTPEGFDLFLAGRLAERLGRDLELVELPSAKVTGALERREIDLALARTLPGESFKALHVIPTGFRSGTTVAMRSDTDIRDWDALAGRTVCVSAANVSGRQIASGQGAHLRVEDSPARSLMLVRTGVCDAAVHDAILLDKLFVERGWDKFSATLPVIATTDLSAFVRGDDAELVATVEAALKEEAGTQDWANLAKRWARNVAFEVYLEQDAPDCH